MRRLSEFIYWVSGWKAVGEREFPDKCIVVSAPHTSNWDFVVGRCFTYIIGIVPKYLIKGELFLPVLGTIIKWNGGIPVYRNSRNNVVDQISELFNSKEKCIIGISPEGTRKRADSWKTGFYHISVKANVPIVLVKMDYKNKEVGIVYTLKPTGNMEEDFKIIQDQFKDITGKIPENYNPEIY